MESDILAMMSLSLMSGPEVTHQNGLLELVVHCLPNRSGPAGGQQEVLGPEHEPTACALGNLTVTCILGLVNGAPTWLEPQPL